MPPGGHVSICDMPLVSDSRLIYTVIMMNTECNYRSTFTDSGDRGADMADHERAFHPDHTHVWDLSPYDWEQLGTTHIAPGDRTLVTPRPVVPMRCTVCRLRQEDDASGKCA